MRSADTSFWMAGADIELPRFSRALLDGVARRLARMLQSRSELCQQCLEQGRASRQGRDQNMFLGRMPQIADCPEAIERRRPDRGSEVAIAAATAARLGERNAGVPAEVPRDSIEREGRRRT